MIKGLIDKWKARKEADEFLEKVMARPETKITWHFMQELFANKDEYWTKWSEGKDDARWDLMMSVLNAAEKTALAQNPRATMRDMLCNEINHAAWLNAILLIDDAELLKRVFAEHEQAKKMAYEADDPNDLACVRDVVHIYFQRASLNFRVLNTIRFQMCDNHHDKARDWFVPFSESQLLFHRIVIWSLYEHRDVPCPIEKAVGITYWRDKERAIVNEEAGAAMRLLNSWAPIIREGHEHPKLVWSERWKAELPEVPVPF